MQNSVAGLAAALQTAGYEMDIGYTYLTQLRRREDDVLRLAAYFL
jgi:hypothetical protein